MPAYAWLVLFILSLGSIVSYIDRQIINLLVEPIKLDLGVNDTEIGLLQGFSFALFYAVLALPLARMADTGNRVRVISFGILCWSLATFGCGLASSFALLFIARVFVGVGEATLAPSGYSLLPDYFPKSRASIAISIFTGSGFIGSGLAYIIGGRVVTALNAIGSLRLPLIGELHPWQMAFVCAAAPGIVLLLLMLLVKEPPRSNTANVDATQADESRLSAVIVHLRVHPRLFTGLFIGLSMVAAGSFAINTWTPTFLIRVYGWSPADVGLVFGSLVVVASAGGVFTGGAVATALMRRNVSSANLLVPLVSALAAIPLAIAFPLMPTATLSLTVLAPALFLSAVPFGCGTAVFPLVSPNRIRAQIVAIYLLLANIVGFTLGPTSIGMLTDFVYRRPDLIGYSLATSPPLFFLLGAGLLGWAIAPYRSLMGPSSGVTPAH
ncbi:MFS transporter [Sphingomonas sp. 28-63-12]|uniref:MFS transporter n=1 Tax=Sphingomonas sp. 28-63-12 TaxID=1970434 RepID=UPI0035A96F0D